MEFAILFVDPFSSFSIVWVLGLVYDGGSRTKSSYGSVAEQRNRTSGETTHPRGVRRRSFPVSISSVYQTDNSVTNSSCLKKGEEELFHFSRARSLSGSEYHH